MKHPPQEPNQVPSNLAVGALLGVIAAIAIGCVSAHAIAAWRTGELAGDPSAPAEQLQGVPAEVNAIETLPFSVEAQGLEEHRVAASRLSSYGWIDRGRRILHVPIDVAFDVYLASRPASRPAPWRGGAP
jgi:hypothetical protein